MPVHAGAPHGAQDRPVGTAGDGAFDGPLDSGWQWGQDDLAALASHSQHAVAVLFSEVGDVRTAGFELQVRQPQGG
ncbi:MAG: hypothetical protein ACQERF_09360 [Actinomycetota bacterium]